MRRAWLLSLTLVGCSFHQSGLGESSPLTDGALADSALAEDSFVALDTAVAEDTADSQAADTELPDNAPIDTAPPDPLFIECETGAVFGEMSLVSDTIASGGKWASVPTTTTGWTDDGAGLPPSRVELPVTLPAGTWYVWVAMYTRSGDSDAMYVGFAAGGLRRFYTLNWNKFVWVGADGGGARLAFTVPAGATKLSVGAGEPGTGCDRVALTQNATWTPP